MRRIRTLLSLDGLPLPATASRDDVRRKGSQAALQKTLDAAASKLTFDGESVASLAAAARDGARFDVTAPLVLQAVELLKRRLVRLVA